MKLSKKFTTVTPFSKLLALALFIILPFLGFYLGTKYQEKTLKIENPAVIESFKEVYPSCTLDGCPKYFEMTATNDKHYEYVRPVTGIIIQTAMTQGAGKLIIVDEQGKKLFDSGEQAGIGVEEVADGNGFILKYSSMRDENMKNINYEVRYIWKDEKFVENPQK